MIDIDAIIERNGKNLPVLPLGARLGQGGYKVAWELLNATDKVALIGNVAQIVTEVKALNKLESLGIPCLKVYDVLFEFRVEPKEQYKNGLFGYAAMIVDRYEMGSKDRNTWQKLPDILNEKSIESASEIIKKVAEARIEIQDPQFLFHRDGSIVVSDPFGIQEHSTQTYGLEVIKNVADTVEFLKAYKAQDVVAKNLYNPNGYDTIFTTGARWRRDRKALDDRMAAEAKAKAAEEAKAAKKPAPEAQDGYV